VRIFFLWNPNSFPDVGALPSPTCLFFFSFFSPCSFPLNRPPPRRDDGRLLVFLPPFSVFPFSLSAVRQGPSVFSAVGFFFACCVIFPFPPSSFSPFSLVSLVSHPVVSTHTFGPATCTFAATPPPWPPVFPAHLLACRRLFSPYLARPLSDRFFNTPSPCNNHGWLFSGPPSPPVPFFFHYPSPTSRVFFLVPPKFPFSPFRHPTIHKLPSFLESPFSSQSFWL